MAESLCCWPETAINNIVNQLCEVAQLCPTLCHPWECKLPGSVHGIFQARVLEWLAISFSRESSWPRDWTWVFCIARRRFTIRVTRETPIQNVSGVKKKLKESNYWYNWIYLPYLLLFSLLPLFLFMFMSNTFFFYLLWF